MIECTDEYIYYTTFSRKNRRHGKRRKRFFLLIIIIVLCSALAFHVNGSVYGLVASLCEDYVNSYAVSSINTAVISSLEGEVKYSDLVTVEKNGNGDITLISQNALKINSISRAVVDKTEKMLVLKLSEGIPVPIMAFTGIKFASGYGTKVRYNALTVSSVNCEFVGKFISVGVNQTLHSLYLRVVCKVNVEFLHKRKVCETTSDVLISEAVLVGKVPDVYLGGTLFG